MPADCRYLLHSFRYSLLLSPCQLCCVIVFRGHWGPLELAFKAWRKVAAEQVAVRGDSWVTDAASPMLNNTSDDVSSQAVDSLFPDLECLISDNLVHPAHRKPHIRQSAADAAAAMDDTTSGNDSSLSPDSVQIHVSLADYPTRPPWRPLVNQWEVLAPQGLQKPPVMRIAKMTRDLRELEGQFLVKDWDGCVGRLVLSAIKRHEPTAELKALARAEVPMTVVSALKDTAIHHYDQCMYLFYEFCSLHRSVLCSHCATTASCSSTDTQQNMHSIHIPATLWLLEHLQLN